MVLSVNSKLDYSSYSTVVKLMGPWRMIFRLFCEALSGQNLVHLCWQSLAGVDLYGINNGVPLTEHMHCGKEAYTAFGGVMLVQ